MICCRLLRRVLCSNAVVEILDGSVEEHRLSIPNQRGPRAVKDHRETVKALIRLEGVLRFSHFGLGYRGAHYRDAPQLSWMPRETSRERH